MCVARLGTLLHLEVLGLVEPRHDPAQRPSRDTAFDFGVEHAHDRPSPTASQHPGPFFMRLPRVDELVREVALDGDAAGPRVARDVVEEVAEGGGLVLDLGGEPAEVNGRDAAYKLGAGKEGSREESYAC